MADEDRLELELDELPSTGADQSAVTTVVSSIEILLADFDWLRDEPVEFDGVPWRPHLSSDGQIIHVILGTELRHYVRKRLSAARAAGIRAAVALTVDALFDEDVLEFFVREEIDLLLVELPDTVKPPDTALGTIAYELEVSGATRRTLAAIGWAQCLDSSADVHLKGRRLEGLIAFLLSQIDGLEIKERNLRTETEELDIVVRQRVLGGRSWQIPGAPFIIVEAKNWHTRKVGQSEFSSFYTKLLGKRKTVRIALLVCTLGFSDEALIQELRGSREELVVVFVGPDELGRWVDAESGDNCFEEIVEHAMLR